MILQSLNDYYRRKMADPDPAARLPAFGLEDKEIPFILEITTRGELVSIKDTRRIEGKKKIADRFLVPKGVKKASGVVANLLWDTAEYVLGVDGKGRPDRVAKQTEAFRRRIEELQGSAGEDDGIAAVLRFLDRNPLSAVEPHECFQEIRETNAVVTFRLAGDTDLVCQRPSLVGHVMDSTADESDDRPARACLVTGEIAQPERLHSSIKGVWGAQTAGANIVSFNLRAFASFGKEQGDNAPVSQAAAFAYTTALNHLLRKGSRQRLQVGDASTVFWAQRQDEIEDRFASVFGDADDADNTERLRALLEAIQAGKFDGARGDNRFFVLGLAPNAARISVRFWQAAPLREIAHRIRGWFDDVRIARAPHDPEFPSLFRLLTACAVQNKADNIPPSLGGDIMRAVLSGSPFPASWLNAAVRRSRAEQDVSYFRAAAIKACLNRGGRNQPGHTEFQPMLDTTNANTAYRLGRLFAALEKVQEEASPGLNATIRDRYYGAASSMPVAVFTTLLRLKNHHIAKVENRGRATNFEKLFGEILGGIEDFPAHLSLPDQGRFALGYYHQRQSFFTPKAE
jgi:CRISPR-associated protein Csd1